MSVPGVLAAATFGVGVLQSWQEYQQGQYAKGVSRVEAQSLKQQAQYAYQQAGAQTAQADYEAAHQIAAATAGVAASGIVETEGSPELIKWTSANQQRLNDMYTRYAANVSAAGYQTQAAITESQGVQTAQGATVGAVLGTISSGISAYTGYKYGYNPFTSYGPSAGASLGVLGPSVPSTSKP